MLPGKSSPGVVLVRNAPRRPRRADYIPGKVFYNFNYRPVAVADNLRPLIIPVLLLYLFPRIRMPGRYAPFPRVY
jgi:hypothetical protein